MFQRPAGARPHEGDSSVSSGIASRMSIFGQAPPAAVSSGLASRMSMFGHRPSVAVGGGVGPTSPAKFTPMKVETMARPDAARDGREASLAAAAAAVPVEDDLTPNPLALAASRAAAPPPLPPAQPAPQPAAVKSAFVNPYARSSPPPPPPPAQASPPPPAKMAFVDDNLPPPPPAKSIPPPPPPAQAVPPPPPPAATVSAGSTPRKSLSHPRGSLNGQKRQSMTMPPPVKRSSFINGTKVALVVPAAAAPGAGAGATAVAASTPPETYDDGAGDFVPALASPPPPPPGPRPSVLKIANKSANVVSGRRPSTMLAPAPAPAVPATPPAKARPPPPPVADDDQEEIVLAPTPAAPVAAVVVPAGAKPARPPPPPAGGPRASLIGVATIPSPTSAESRPHPSLSPAAPPSPAANTLSLGAARIPPPPPPLTPTSAGAGSARPITSDARNAGEHPDRSLPRPSLIISSSPPPARPPPRPSISSPPLPDRSTPSPSMASPSPPPDRFAPRPSVSMTRHESDLPPQEHERQPPGTGTPGRPPSRALPPQQQQSRPPPGRLGSTIQTNAGANDTNNGYNGVASSPQHRPSVLNGVSSSSPNQQRPPPPSSPPAAAGSGSGSTGVGGVVGGGIVSARLANAKHLFSPLQFAPPIQLQAGTAIRPGSSIFAKPIHIGGGGGASSQNYRGFVTPLDASSVLLRVCLPAGEGHTTVNASVVKDLAFLKRKIVGKLERGGRLAGDGTITTSVGHSKLTEAKLRLGVFYVAGTQVQLADTDTMKATLEKLRPFIITTTTPKTATLELRCDGLSAPVLLAGYDPAAARAIASAPPSSSSSSSTSPASDGGSNSGGGGGALEHVTSSRPKVRGRKKGASGGGSKMFSPHGSGSGSGPAGLRNFTLNPNKPMPGPVEEEQTGDERD